MAGMVGSSGSGLYKVAISRSPVVDWRYYGEWCSEMSAFYKCSNMFRDAGYQ